MLRTKNQRKKLCLECPVARVVDMLGDPCSLLVMRDLVDDPRRFNELEDALGGMSSRTLTKTLRKLEKGGLIVRKRFSRTARFHYEPTEKGKAFKKVIDAMRSYGKKYL